MDKFKGTTILSIRKDNKVVVAGDGQVTLGNSAIKKTARKVRRIYNDKIIVGFAGATADAFTLTERLEGKLEQYSGNLTRASVELAREWRTDKYLRQLEAMMIAADDSNTYLISGTGDVIEPDEGVISIGSGSISAQSAALALFRNTKMDIEDIVLSAMEIAAETCIYTNSNFTIEKIEKK
ncbi:MAG: ATP-dependent protease subunit HslV [Desulfobacteraceae bacterium]|nr:ATP-dependent protease subunit HslV [Desulfobacteraceae bacterium]MCB9495146.1 ATP-dependent protease subunit HslV [Desulfobacteraceae bacterium]